MYAVDVIHHEGDHSMHTEMRYIGYILLATNIRSLINIANDIEGNQYYGSKLFQVNRFNYLSKLIVG